MVLPLALPVSLPCSSFDERSSGMLPHNSNKKSNEKQHGKIELDYSRSNSITKNNNTFGN